MQGESFLCRWEMLARFAHFSDSRNNNSPVDARVDDFQCNGRHHRITPVLALSAGAFHTSGIVEMFVFHKSLARSFCFTGHGLKCLRLALSLFRAHQFT